MTNEQFVNMWKIYHKYLDNSIKVNQPNYQSAKNALDHMNSIILNWLKNSNLTTILPIIGKRIITEISYCIKDIIYINACMKKVYKDIPIGEIHNADKVRPFIYNKIENLNIIPAYKWLKRQSHLILVEKAKEYSIEDDRFHNFKKATKLFGYYPQYFCVMFMIKHVISLSDILDGTIFPTFDIYVSKIVDIYNYLLLLTGIIIDSCGFSEKEYTDFFKNIL